MDSFETIRKQLPMAHVCSYCGRNMGIRTAFYMETKTPVRCSHGICPDCNIKIREDNNLQQTRCERAKVRVLYWWRYWVKR